MLRPGRLRRHLAVAGLSVLAGLAAVPAARAADPTAASATVQVEDRYRVDHGDGTADYSIPIDLLAFASDADGDVLAFAVAQPTAGQVFNQGSGLVLFQIDAATADALTDDPTFDFTVSDGRGGTATATVTLALHPNILLPKGHADAFFVAVDAPTTLPVLANDEGAQTIAGFTQGSRGTVAPDASGTELVFTPAPGFAAGDADGFTYIPANADGEGSPTTVMVTGRASVPPVLEVRQHWDDAPVADGGTVVFPDLATAGEPTSVRLDLYNPTADTLYITNPASAVDGPCFSVTSGEPVPDSVPPSQPLGPGELPPGFRVRIQCPSAGSYSATVTLETRSGSGVLYQPFSFTLTAEVVEPPAVPTPLVVRERWDQAVVAAGAVLDYPQDPLFFVPTSIGFDLSNPTAETLEIVNPTTAVTGSGWSVTPGEPIPASIGPGETAGFRLRLYWDAPQTVVATLTLETRAASGTTYDPFTYQVTATLQQPELDVFRGWPGADPAELRSGDVVELPTVAAAGDVNHSAAFQISNALGDGTLVILNPDSSLVSGTCFSIRSGGLPDAQVPAGGTTPFRVWWGGSCGAGTYTATVTVRSNALPTVDPLDDGETRTFTVVGRVADTPLLTCQPADARVLVGGTATFSVCTDPDNGTLAYAWFKDGAAIAGSGPSLTLSAVTGADEGLYHAEVTNEAGTTVSAAAKLTVVEKPVVSQPADQTAPLGGSATFSVSVSSPPEDGPFTYQWQQLPPGASSFQSIAGATSASFTVTNVTLAMSGTRYRCLVHNDAGQTNSGPGTLTVQTPDVEVARNWDGVAVGEGTTFDFGTAERSAPKSYLFRITNAGEATLTLSNPTSLVSGTCWSQIEDPAATVAPGGYTTFRVRLQCGTAGTKTGTVTLRSDDPASPYVFYLRGTVVASDVSVSQAWDGAAVGAGATVTFPSVETDIAVSRLFRITNTGGATLTLTNPAALVSGACWSEIEYPASTIAPGGSTTFRVRLLCGSAGTKTGTVSIQSNDPSSPYVFYVRGTVTAPDPPKVSVTRAWDGVAVLEGSTFTFPGTTTGTAVSRLFRITNTGEVTLTLSNPTALLSGACWSEIEYPASTIAPGGSTTFRVRLLCSSAGTKTGTISIQSNDPTSPFVFYVRGDVTAPDPSAVSVTRNWDGVAVPEGSTFTFPGTTAGTAVSRLFRITNTGPGTLTLSNPTSLVSGSCWSEIESPVSTVAPGAYTTFRVRLLCSTAGTKSATVRIDSNEPGTPYTFYLTGTVN